MIVSKNSTREQQHKMKGPGTQTGKRADKKISKASFPPDLGRSVAENQPRRRTRSSLRIRRKKRLALSPLWVLAERWDWKKPDYSPRI